MKTMGLANSVHWVAWFVTSFIQMSLTMILLTIILTCGEVLSHSDPFLIFLLLEMFGAATIMLSYVPLSRLAMCNCKVYPFLVSL